MRAGLIAALLLSPLLALADTSYEVAIDGMTCGPCVESVKKQLNAMTDVDTSSVKVSLKENKATLTMKTDDASAVEKIKAAIKKAGFKVTAVQPIKPEEAKKN